jgi:hypothetical protein
VSRSGNAIPLLGAMIIRTHYFYSQKKHKCFFANATLAVFPFSRRLFQGAQPLWPPERALVPANRQPNGLVGLPADRKPTFA